MSETKLSPRFAAILLAFVGLAWGTIPLFVRNDVPATALVGARVTFGAAALVVAAVAFRRFTIPKVRRGRLILSGLLLTAHWITFFGAIKLTTVAVALSVVYLGPIAASILSGPILGESVAPRLWAALSIAGLGTLLVVQPWSVGDGQVSWEGVAVAALSGALLATLMIVGKPVAQELGGLTMAIGELLVASIVLAPATYQALTQYPDYLLNFVVLGAVFTGFAGFVYWEVFRVLPVAVVSVLMYIEPASAVVWAAVFLDEAPSPLTWLGVGFVIIGGAVAATSAQEGEVRRGHANL
jgi:drug/metabolite transporter (DMT)-like permease